MYYIGTFPVNSLIDLLSLCFIGGLIVLSLISLLFISHLCIKSRSTPHLRNFNTLWTVRLLLVSFISLWALNEVARVPCVRQHYFSLSQQAELCKLHVLLSLGFYEPGFLLTLLFLLTISIKKITNPHKPWPVLFLCLPIFLLQFVLLYSSPIQLPNVFHQTFVDIKDSSGKRIVLCCYPLSSTIVFSLFGAAYSAWFLISCCKLLCIVINKGLRIRIWALAFIIAPALPVQILLLGVSTWWSPSDDVYACLTMVVFLSAVSCAAVGEGILVIRPIVDALVAGAGDPQWNQSKQQQTLTLSDEQVATEESSTQPLMVKVED